jgi:hypothetical protein
MHKNEPKLLFPNEPNYAYKQLKIKLLYAPIQAATDPPGDPSRGNGE